MTVPEIHIAIAQSNSWSTTISALMMPMIALIAAWIAYQQWRIARNKLKFDLFDRRISHFQAATRLISTITAEGSVQPEAISAFIASTRDVRWLFNEEIAAYLQEDLVEKALRLHVIEEELKGLGVGSARTAKAHEWGETIKWFPEQHKVLADLLDPYLQLDSKNKWRITRRHS